MIASLRGAVTLKTEESAVIEAGGVGYEVFFCEASLRALGPEGTQVFVLTAESVSMYGGSALYGFLSREEKELFELLRGAVPGTGAKKALDHLNKALRSLPDFRRAVAKNDPALLTSIFGFTAKTADKLIAALKGKMPDLPASGGRGAAALSGGEYVRTLAALTSLGFRAGEAKAALEAASAEERPDAAGVEDLIRRALKRLSPG